MQLFPSAINDVFLSELLLIKKFELTIKFALFFNIIFDPETISNVKFLGRIKFLSIINLSFLNLSFLLFCSTKNQCSLSKITVSII